MINNTLHTQNYLANKNNGPLNLKIEGEVKHGRNHAKNVATHKIATIDEKALETKEIGLTTQEAERRTSQTWVDALTTLMQTQTLYPQTFNAIPNIPVTMSKIQQQQDNMIDWSMLSQERKWNVENLLNLDNMSARSNNLTPNTPENSEDQNAMGLNIDWFALTQDTNLSQKVPMNVPYAEPQTPSSQIFSRQANLLTHMGGPIQSQLATLGTTLDQGNINLENRLKNAPFLDRTHTIHQGPSHLFANNASLFNTSSSQQIRVPKTSTLHTKNSQTKKLEKSKIQCRKSKRCCGSQDIQSLTGPHSEDMFSNQRKIVMEAQPNRNWYIKTPGEMSVMNSEVLITTRVDPHYLSVPQDLFAHMKYQLDMSVTIDPTIYDGSNSYVASIRLIRFAVDAKLNPSSLKDQQHQHKHLVLNQTIDDGIVGSDIKYPLRSCKNNQHILNINHSIRVNKQYSYHATSHLYGFEISIRSTKCDSPSFIMQSAPFKIFARKRNNAPLTAAQKRHIQFRKQTSIGPTKKRKGNPPHIYHHRLNQIYDMHLNQSDIQQQMEDLIQQHDAPVQTIQP